jgi:hypothetical protein
MKKIIALIAIAVLAIAAWYHHPTMMQLYTGGNTFTPSFVVDYAKCGTAPTISESTVTFGAGSTCAAGRVVSQHGYKNVTKITATIDLSKVTQNYVNAAVYMIEDPTNPSAQPSGGNYCDAGGNNNSWNCREIDIIETNGNKITQTTMHLGNGGSSAPQRYEYSFAETADNSCFNYSNMKDDPTAGTHSLVGIIDMSKPFQMTTVFNYTTPGMTVTYSQDGKSVVVYDTANGSGAEGSGTLDLNDLITSMANGYWLELSFWQGYSPTGPNGTWWNGSCSWGSLCNSSGQYWSITDIVVTADSEI